MSFCSVRECSRTLFLEYPSYKNRKHNSLHAFIIQLVLLLCPLFQYRTTVVGSACSPKIEELD
jgi:hypothetical protein